MRLPTGDLRKQRRIVKSFVDPKWFIPYPTQNESSVNKKNLNIFYLYIKIKIHVISLTVTTVHKMVENLWQKMQGRKRTREDHFGSDQSRNFMLIRLHLKTDLKSNFYSTVLLEKVWQVTVLRLLYLLPGRLKIERHFKQETPSWLYRIFNFLNIYSVMPINPRRL